MIPDHIHITTMFGGQYISLSTERKADIRNRLLEVNDEIGFEVKFAPKLHGRPGKWKIDYVTCHIIADADNSTMTYGRGSNWYKAFSDCLKNYIENESKKNRSTQKTRTATTLEPA